MFADKKSIIAVTLFFLLSAAALTASETGSARFNVIRPILVGATTLPAGQYMVEWTTSDDDAKVTFLRAGNESAGIEVHGKIEKVNNKYDNNALAIGKDSSGQEVLKQIQFSGKNIRIVFKHE